MNETSTAGTLTRRAFVLLAFVGTMWLVRIIDTFRPEGSSIAEVGVIPRTGDHLLGVAAAPFIHANWAHLLANTVPLLVLGTLILLNGIAEFTFVTVMCALGAGVGTWIFGGNANHIGASGVVFGYLGYLLFRPAFDHRVWFMLAAIIVAALYGTMLVWSVVPQSGISWSGHFFGFVGGVLAARLRGRATGRPHR